jgi:hypothetical protein
MQIQLVYNWFRAPLILLQIAWNNCFVSMFIPADAPGNCRATVRLQSIIVQATRVPLPASHAYTLFG